MRFEAAQGLGLHDDRTPGGVVKSRRVPAGHFQAGVIDAAHEQVAFADRAVGGFPGAVGADDFGAAVGVIQAQVGEEAGFVAVVIALAGEGQIAGVPAVAENGAKDIFALLELAGEVVAEVVDALAVIGPAGREHIVVERWPFRCSS